MKLALCMVSFVALGNAAVYYSKGSWDNANHGKEINQHEPKTDLENGDIEFEVEKKNEPVPAKHSKLEDQRIDAIREALERYDKEHVRETRSHHAHGYHYRHGSHSSESSDSSDSSESHEHHNHGQGQYYPQGYQQNYQHGYPTGYQQGYGGWQGGYRG